MMGNVPEEITILISVITVSTNQSTNVEGIQRWKFLKQAHIPILCGNIW